MAKTATPWTTATDLLPFSPHSLRESGFCYSRWADSAGAPAVVDQQPARRYHRLEPSRGRAQGIIMEHSRSKGPLMMNSSLRFCSISVFAIVLAASLGVLISPQRSFALSLPRQPLTVLMPTDRLRPSEVTMACDLGACKHCMAVCQRRLSGVHQRLYHEDYNDDTRELDYISCRNNCEAEMPCCAHERLPRGCCR